MRRRDPDKWDRDRKLGRALAKERFRNPATPEDDDPDVEAHARVNLRIMLGRAEIEQLAKVSSEELYGGDLAA